MAFPQRPRLKSLSVNKIIPNVITLLALSAGLTSIRFGLRGEWQAAVLAVVIAAFFDGLDGRVARLLKGTSKFGAELDSLADIVSFGVAPSVLLYMWSLQSLEGLGWALSLLVAICCALRLARFNTMIAGPDLPPYAANYFVGVPAPAGAFLALLPMSLSFWFPSGPFQHPLMVGLFVVIAGGLMVSQVPTFSFKKVRIPAHWFVPLMIVVALTVAFLVTEPWATFSVLGLAYLISIPFARRSYRDLERRAKEAPLPQAVCADDDDDEYEEFPSPGVDL